MLREILPGHSCSRYALPRDAVDDVLHTPTFQNERNMMASFEHKGSLSKPLRLPYA